MKFTEFQNHRLYFNYFQAVFLESRDFQFSVVLDKFVRWIWVSGDLKLHLGDWWGDSERMVGDAGG